jgi:hypothetical protein
LEIVENYSPAVVKKVKNFFPVIIMLLCNIGAPRLKKWNNSTFWKETGA